jgi:cyclophilin family peptidyl-prolyl cis-trans isomerase
MCPFCYTEVNKENLEKHLLKVHGDLDKGDFEQKGLKKPVGAVGEKKAVKEGTRVSKKGQPFKTSRTSAALAVVAVIVMISLFGAVFYQTVILSDDSSDDKVEPNPIANITTTLGTIRMVIYKNQAPVTAGNFINLAESGFYNGIIFHRIVPGFVVQGGGFTPDGDQKTSGEIPWENTGILNNKYTVSMARSGNPDSQSDSGTATSQFFINTENNPQLDSYTYKFVVFGKIIDGFDVVEAIEALPTGTYNGMEDWPDDPPIITSIVIED